MRGSGPPRPAGPGRRRCKRSAERRRSSRSRRSASRNGEAKHGLSQTVFTPSQARWSSATRCRRVADAVAVGVGEALRIDLVEDGIGEPLGGGACGRRHGTALRRIGWDGGERGGSRGGHGSRPGHPPTPRLTPRPPRPRPDRRRPPAPAPAPAGGGSGATPSRAKSSAARPRTRTTIPLATPGSVDALAARGTGGRWSWKVPSPPRRSATSQVSTRSAASSSAAMDGVVRGGVEVAGDHARKTGREDPQPRREELRRARLAYALSWSRSGC